MRVKRLEKDKFEEIVSSNKPLERQIGKSDWDRFIIEEEGDVFYCFDYFNNTVSILDSTQRALYNLPINQEERCKSHYNPHHEIMYE